MSFLSRTRAAGVVELLSFMTRFPWASESVVVEEASSRPSSFNPGWYI